MTIYQSSFGDGGSKLRFKGWPLAGGATFPVEGEVGGATQLSAAAGGAPLGLEFTGLRVINVENLGEANAAAAAASGATDVRRVDLVQRLENHLGSGAIPRVLEDGAKFLGPHVTGRWLPFSFDSVPVV